MIGVSVPLLFAGTVGPFSPADLGGLIAWYRSDFAVTGGGTASSLIDQSTSGNDAVQVVGGSEPTYNASDPDFNGFPSVEHSGAPGSMWLETSAPLEYGANTIVFVGNATGTASYLYSRSIATDVSNGEYLNADVAATSVARSAVFSVKSIGSNWGLSLTPRTVVRRFNGSNAGHTMRINGTPQTLSTITGGNPGTVPVTGKYAGLYNTAFNAYPLYPSQGTIGKYAEWIFYNRSLSDLEMARVETYLRARYGHY